MLDRAQRPKLTKKATLSCGPMFFFLTVFLFWLLRDLPQSEKFVFRRCALTQTSKEMVWIQADHTSHHLRPASQQQNIPHKNQAVVLGQQTKLDLSWTLYIDPVKYTCRIFHCKLISIICIFCPDQGLSSVENFHFTANALRALEEKVSCILFSNAFANLLPVLVRCKGF